MNKHTPGPWKVNPFNKAEGQYTIGAELAANGYMRIADICTARSSEEALSNAALIAAAPEMLNLLRVCMVEVMPDDEGGNLELFQLIKNLVEKAEGRS